MLAPILTVLAKCGYLPANYSITTIHTQIDKLIFDSIEKDELVPYVQELNSLLGIDPEKLEKDLSEEPGPYCPTLEVSLETSCKYKKCKNHNSQFTWGCSKLGAPRQDVEEIEIESCLQEFNTSVNLLEDALDPDFEYPKGMDYCIGCGKPTDNQEFGKVFKICRSCQVSMNSVRSLAFLLEARYGRPVKEIINYVIQIWDTVQQQAKVLGIRPENFQSLCSNYNINMKKYRQIGDSRFINPFLTRKKGRPLIDSYVLRLYSSHLRSLQDKGIRPEVLKLEELLLSEANLLLEIRELELFDLALS